MAPLGERPQRDFGSPVGLLITLAAMAASVIIALTATDTARAIGDEPVNAAAFLGLTLLLQLFSIPVYGRGSISVSTVGLLAAGFALGPGPAMVIAVRSCRCSCCCSRRS